MIDVAPELISFLKEEYNRCQDDELGQERETAIQRYNGEPYGDEEEGRSQVVARDTSETVDYMTISILRLMVSGDDVVEFVHHNAELAHIATQTIKHLFMDEQDGYRILLDWLKAGLLEKNAVAMTYGEPQPKKRLESTVSALALAAAQQQGVEIIQATETGEVHPEEGPMFKVVALQEQPPRFCDAAVPNEEFYCSLDARTITEAALKGRKVRKTVSQLVEEGHEAEDLERVANAEDLTSTLSDSRESYRNSAMNDRSGPNRVIWWHEEWARYDANGDGIAELLYIERTSDFKVFSITEMEGPEDHPFEDWCPYPMQHRRVGQSLADKTVDLERINTILLRQSLDGIYLSNNPRTYVHEDSISDSTIEDLLTVRPGAITRWKGAVKPETQQDRFDGSVGFQMLEYLAGVRENRTGITRLNQGLDADTLNKTATGQAMLQAQGQQVEEFLARNFVNAAARLFTKKARLLKRFGKPIMVPIDGEYVEVDPSQWPDDMLARPKVGLGSGRKDQRLAYRRELMGLQAQALEAGLGIVDDAKFFNSAKGYCNDTGLGDVTEFFNDPSKPQIDPATGQPVQKQEKPDPEAMKAQADMQAMQQKMQMQAAEMQHKQQLSQVQAQSDQQQASAKFQMEQQAAIAKLQLERERAQGEAELARAKAEFEAQLAQSKMAFEQQMAERQLEHETEHREKQAERDHKVAMSKNREGGDLSK